MPSNYKGELQELWAMYGKPGTMDYFMEYATALLEKAQKEARINELVNLNRVFSPSVRDSNLIVNRIAELNTGSAKPSTEGSRDSDPKESEKGSTRVGEARAFEETCNCCGQVINTGASDNKGESNRVSVTTATPSASDNAQSKEG